MYDNNLKPVLVDVNKHDSLISLNEIKKKLSSKTKVIMPVNLYGGVVNIKEIFIKFEFLNSENIKNKQLGLKARCFRFA